MPVVVIRTGMLRALEYEFDHIVDGCVLGIPGSFTNVVEALESDISTHPGVSAPVSVVDGSSRRCWRIPARESSSVIEDLQREVHIILDVVPGVQRTGTA